VNPSTIIDPYMIEVYKALVDDAFKDAPLNVRQSKAAKILAEANKHFTWEEFKMLQDYIDERLQK